MEYIVSCPLKLNLSLRVTGQREDGFHDLCSLFMALRGPETLTLTPQKRDNVRDSIIVHNEKIPGINIIDKTAGILRDSGFSLPPLDIHIWKQIPPGSGLGGGSGNAAGFVRWAERFKGRTVTEDVVRKLGADVPFLYRSSSLSIVQGTGDIQEDLAETIRLKVIVLFPEWSSPTPEAYRLLDRYYRSAGWPLNPAQAKDEAMRVLRGLSQNRRVGLLPNDFTPVLLECLPDYEMFFAAAESSKALGYGITGSGSACFALFDTLKNAQSLTDSCQEWTWVKKILALE